MGSVDGVECINADPGPAPEMQLSGRYGWSGDYTTETVLQWPNDNGSPVPEHYNIFILTTLSTGVAYAPPSGFDEIDNGAVGSLDWHLCHKVAGASEPNFYTMGVDHSANQIHQLVAVRGYGPVVYAVQTGSGTQATAPSITALRDGSLLVMLWVGQEIVGGTYNPDDYTGQNEKTQYFRPSYSLWATAYAYDSTLYDTAATTGDHLATASGSGGDNVGLSILFSAGVCPGGWSVDTIRVQ